MTVFAIPGKGDYTGVTLGPQVAAWMEANLVHGPGDIRGQPYTLDVEKTAILYRIYELHAPGTKTPEGQDIGGRRRFKRVGLSVRKGWAKTEFAAAIAAAELHPDAPVRFREWAKDGITPIGTGVSDPYIPMVAYTEEQSEELAFGALKVMLEDGALAEDFDIQQDRIIVLDGGGKAKGKAESLASSPDSRDGARTSLNIFDETHRMATEKLVKSHQTMLANIPKRKAADAWTLEITTAFEPGLGSVAEGTMEYAKLVSEGRIEDSNLCFYHRQASDEYKLYNEKDEPIPQGMREAVIDASGPASVWTDVDAIVGLALDPQTDRAYWERVWLNRPVQQSLQAFPMPQIDLLVVPKKTIIVPGTMTSKEVLWHPDKDEKITLGFDGAQTRDTTALVGTHLATGRQFLIACWKNPGGERDWKVPADEVDATIRFAFSQWDVWRLYADPYYWDTHVADWVARYMYRGKPRVFEWATNTHKKMALSLKAYVTAMKEGVWHYDGDETFRSHLANARKASIPILDEDGQNMWLIRKERPDSPLKIDCAMAGCLSWEAYRDAIAAGATINVRSRAPLTIY
jgi:phage terminase large subunit-like protein